MRILQVIPYFVPAWDYGGPLHVCYELSKELVNRGHEVTVYTTDALDAKNRVRQREELLDGIRVRRFKNLSNAFAYKHNIFLAVGMPFTIRKELANFNVIHVHEYRTLQNVIIRYYAKRLGIPYVVQAHGSAPKDMPKQRLKQLYDFLWEYKILRDASKVIAVTPTEAEQYRSLGVDEHRIEIVPNGIDLAEYDSLPQKGEFRQKYSITENEKMILYLARIHKIKGPDLLVRAYASLSQELHDSRLVIAGPDDGYLSTLKRLITDLNIGPKVLFTGPLYGKDKLEAYVDADVYVLPSVYEIFGVALLEACACGTPVVVTDRCGIADVIDGHAGLAVPSDKDQLGRAILSILDNEGMRQEFRERGKSLVRERFDWRKIAEQVEKIYAGCLP